MKVGDDQCRAQPEAKAALRSAQWLPTMSSGSASQRTRTWGGLAGQAVVAEQGRPVLGDADQDGVAGLDDGGVHAVACAADRRWSFLLAVAPLSVADGVGSPANAVAGLRTGRDTLSRPDAATLSKPCEDARHNEKSPASKRRLTCPALISP